MPFMGTFKVDQHCPRLAKGNVRAQDVFGVKIAVTERKQRLEVTKGMSDLLWLRGVDDIEGVDDRAEFTCSQFGELRRKPEWVDRNMTISDRVPFGKRHQPLWISFCRTQEETESLCDLLALEPLKFGCSPVIGRLLRWRWSGSDHRVFGTQVNTVP